MSSTAETAHAETAHAETTSYLGRSGQSHVSVGLQEFCLFACTRTSYDTVTALVSRMTGEALVCPQTLCHWVQQKARQRDGCLAAEVAEAACLPMPALADTVDQGNH